MIKKILLKILNKHYMKQGFYDAWGISWLKSAIEEYRASNLPFKDKIWALKRGFYPWRTAQYGMNEENYRDFLSDRDYKRLYPLNLSYRKWIDNKLTMKYVLFPFDEYMPKYYFHLLSERECHVLKLSDCPKECNADYEGILDLLKKKGELAVKPSGGTYGIGFCKLVFKEEKYFINEVEKSALEMHSFLEKLEDIIKDGYEF